ncbi:hypothetical protein NQ318_001050 [Aromia moschata]|uniref:BPTI/Kunitz inhibitor domain-containing protein n=1 Tax=Aromia moschata TaxID=1265417 RepID=A0AAV8ZG22_9CUCU|nr:hypothetical protein NQ318_001050 [Aromia moschata]
MKPTTLKPTTVKSTTLKPTTTQEPITLKPTSLKPTTLKPTTLKPTTQEPTTLKPTTIKPNTTTTEKPTTTITLTKIEPTPIQQTTTKTGYDFIGETEIGIAAATTTTKKPSTTERIKTCNETIFGCCHDRVTQAAGSNFLGCDPIPKSESCSLPQDSGACSNYTVKWRYDMVQGTCREFWYSGCGGNGNRFKSKDVCEKICLNPTSSDRCHLPIVLGRCAKYNLQWFYDKRKGECVKYLYSGCEGNSNRFDTRMECLQLCSPRNQNVSEQDACFLPKDGGTCSRYEPYFYFDRANGICRQFWYGGCGVVMIYENIDTEWLHDGYVIITEVIHVLVRCAQLKELLLLLKLYVKTQEPQLVTEHNNLMSNLKLPHVKGPCKQAIRRWYYDRNSQTCTQFDYGGCHGNNNNFRTREECYSHCLNGSAVDLQEINFLPDI